MIKEPKIVYLHGPPGAARSRKDWVASWVLTAARIWRHVTPFGGRYSASLVQPARIMQSASSVDISTMRSSPMVMRRPENVWTEPIPGGASRRT